MNDGLHYTNLSLRMAESKGSEQVVRDWPNAHQPSQWVMDKVTYKGATIPNKTI